MLHLAMEMLQERAKIKLVHVPYRGGAQITSDVMGGQVDVGMLTTVSAVPMIQQKKLEGLGVTSAKRIDAIHNVPTFGETAELKGFDLNTWTGLFVPAKTPQAVVTRLATELDAVPDARCAQAPGRRRRHARLRHPGQLCPVPEEGKSRLCADREVGQHPGGISHGRAFEPGACRDPSARAARSGRCGGRDAGLRHDLHAHPELAYEEHRTGDIVAARLAEWGYEVHRGLGDTGVVLRCGEHAHGKHIGKRLGLRADMDALPIRETTGLPYASRHDGKMHACGHDGHTATCWPQPGCWPGADQLQGTLNLIFQPAEEGHGGAQKMVEQGLFELFPCDALYAFHNEPGYPAGQFGFRSGVMYSSSDTAIITIRGKGGHGAMPHVAVDPIVVASHLVLALQTIRSREIDPNDMAVVTIGAIHAGDAPNVIPETCELRVTIRARCPEVRQQLRERITAMAHAQAAVHRATAEVDYKWRYPPVMNDRAATDFAVGVAREFPGSNG
jgi:hippurate hydrolase